MGRSRQLTGNSPISAWREVFNGFQPPDVSAATPEVLLALAGDMSPTVRIRVAGHLLCPDEACIVLSTFTDTHTIRVLFAREKLPAACFKNVLATKDPDLIFSAIGHPSCPLSAYFSVLDMSLPSIEMYLVNMTTLPVQVYSGLAWKTASLRALNDLTYNERVSPQVTRVAYARAKELSSGDQASVKQHGSSVSNRVYFDSISVEYFRQLEELSGFSGLPLTLCALEFAYSGLTFSQCCEKVSEAVDSLEPAFLIAAEALDFAALGATSLEEALDMARDVAARRPEIKPASVRSF